MAGGWRISECPRPARMGATVTADGVSFAVFSRHGARVLLSVADETGAGEAALLSLPCRQGDVHFGLLHGAKPGLRYGLRVEGPWAPEHGHRFDAAKLLVDPYATQIERRFRWDERLAQRGVDTLGLTPWGVVSEGPAAVPPLAGGKPAFIYELAVRSFTMRREDVPEGLRGTMAALTAPGVLAHLKRLRVSHVELMPVTAWMDERHLPPLGLSNAWGYNPVNFFAPDPRLAPGGAADLAALCAAYESAGIGVILDVVLNHTAESDIFGPTVSLRGLDNAVYYRHAADDPGQLVNDTGCGNTLALDRAPVVQLAMDSLRHWRRLGVSGFRFDLATVMGRTPGGFSQDAPFFAALRQDPELAGAILIAEPWDLGTGGYQLGGFPAPFAEWNGRFRDDVRRFWRGDAGAAGAMATRLAGSSDLFAATHRGPHAGVSFLAAHDGFTLADLVSYAHKHNEANGEDNRDGDNDSHSWNCGAEGKTSAPDINAARRRDIRALLATLFLSRGVPMLTAGDECGRTQHGNNNAYAQDKPDFWLDWQAADDDLISYVAELARLREAHPLLAADRFLSGAGDPPDAQWLTPAGARITDADWPNLDALCLQLDGVEGSLLIAINRSRISRTLRLPSGIWRKLVASSADEQSQQYSRLPPRSVNLWARGPL